MRTLVTGGAGFIGGHLAAALLDEGADVRVLDDLSGGRVEDVPRGADLVVGDVADAALVARAARGCEVLFHLAAHRAVPRSVAHPITTDRANVAGTLAVLVAARDAGARRVVFASSSSVYGGAEVLPTPEEVPLVPRSPYAVTKLAGEHYCRVFTDLFGLDTVALRYFNVYGPRQRPDSQYAAVVPLFLGALHRGAPPEVHGDGGQTRDYTFVDDAVRANLLAAGGGAPSAGRAYNIAGGRSISVLGLLRLLEQLTGTASEPVHTPPRDGDVRHTEADLTAARRDLGYEPAVELEDGLQRTVDWYRAEVGVAA